MISLPVMLGRFLSDLFLYMIGFLLFGLHLEELLILGTPLDPLFFSLRCRLGVSQETYAPVTVHHRGCLQTFSRRTASIEICVVGPAISFTPLSVLLQHHLELPFQAGELLTCIFAKAFNR